MKARRLYDDIVKHLIYHCFYAMRPMEIGSASLLILTILSLAIVVSTPTRSETMSLEEALAAAYESNPQLEAQRAALRATDEEVAKALAGWRPTVGGNGSYGWQRESQTLLGAQTVQSTPQSQQLTLSQPVFDGRTLPNTAHAKDLVEAGRAQLAATEASVLLNAATAYFAVLRDTEIVDAYHDDITNLRVIAKNTQDRLRLGELTKTDASQAQARLLGSELNLAAAEQQLNSDRAAFEHIVGRPAEKLIDHPIPALPDPDKALQTALALNPTLLESKAQARAADHAVDAAVGAIMPTVSIQAQYGRSIDEIAPGVRQNGLSIIGQLSIPLYQGGAEEASIRQAKQQSSQALLTAMDAERKVREDFSNAWKSLEVSRSAVALATAQSNENGAAYKGSIMESQVGSRTTIDILNADQELIQSKVTTITQQANTTSAAYQILSVMGKMTATDLKLPVKLYDPQDHYDHDATRWFGFGD